MKKLYNTPELSLELLNKLDTMTASGVVDTETELLDRLENTYMMFSNLTE
jgi:hypothetical protein